MQKIFIYNQLTGEFEVNQPEIKLVNEFEDLWLMAKEYAGCKEDKSGMMLGNKEANAKFALYCKYVYLFSDAASPYRDYTDEERRIQAGYDSMMGPSEMDDARVSLACKKWSDMQEQDRNIRLLKAGQAQVDDMINFFNKVKEEGRKTGYNAKDIKGNIDALKDIGEISDMLDSFEERIRVGETTKSALRGGAIEGFLVDFTKEKRIRAEKARLEEKKDSLKEIMDEVESVDAPEAIKPIRVRKAQPKQKKIEELERSERWKSLLGKSIKM